jgi:hypothetical protein
MELLSASARTAMLLRLFFATADFFLRIWHGMAGQAVFVWLRPFFFFFFLSLLRRSIASKYAVYPGIFLRLVSTVHSGIMVP